VYLHHNYAGTHKIEGFLPGHCREKVSAYHKKKKPRAKRAGGLPSKHKAKFTTSVPQKKIFITIQLDIIKTLKC
jgi:hypothetical protein